MIWIWTSRRATVSPPSPPRSDFCAFPLRKPPQGSPTQTENKSVSGPRPPRLVSTRKTIGRSGYIGDRAAHADLFKFCVGYLRGYGMRGTSISKRASGPRRNRNYKSQHKSFSFLATEWKRLEDRASKISKRCLVGGVRGVRKRNRDRRCPRSSITVCLRERAGLSVLGERLAGRVTCSFALAPRDSPQELNTFLDHVCGRPNLSTRHGSET